MKRGKAREGEIRKGRVRECWREKERLRWRDRER